MPSEVWAMTLEDVRMLTTYWTSHPPASELIELQIGWKTPEPERPTPAASSVDLDSFAAEVNAACGGT